MQKSKICDALKTTFNIFIIIHIMIKFKIWINITLAKAYGMIIIAVIKKKKKKKKKKMLLEKGNKVDHS